jgi:ABC-type sugar transport system substrate-binding protein
MADNQAVAAIRAAEAANIAVGEKPKQLVVVGGNCLKEGMDNIRSGKMHSTITQLPTELGTLAADVVNDHFAKKQLPKNVLQPLETITKANVTKWEGPCTY